VSSTWVNWRPVLVRGVRYHRDEVRGQHQLLFPEGLLVLNDTAAAIVNLCDGRSTSDICDELAKSFPDVDLCHEVDDFLDRLAQRRLIRNADAH
jgi:coenzyme PQQ biosynthesis protein PqqD